MIRFAVELHQLALPLLQRRNKDLVQSAEHLIGDALSPVLGAED